MKQTTNVTDALKKDLDRITGSFSETKSNNIYKEEKAVTKQSMKKTIVRENPGTRKFGEGVVVSNNPKETGLNNNDLIIGGAGSGKTGGYIYNLLADPHGSIIVSDTKGLLCRQFGDYLREQGYKVQVLDFVNPRKSAAFNPLDYIGRNYHGMVREKDIKKLAATIVPNLDRDEPFWEKAATRYISMLIGYVLEALPEDEINMLSVVKLHRKMQTGIGKEILEQWMEKYPDSFAAKKYAEMAGSQVAEKMWNSIMEFANEALDPFGYGDFDPIFAGENGIDIAAMGREKTVLFLNSSDNDTSFHILCNIFNTMALQTLIDEADRHEDGRLEIPVRIVLDDFAASSKIENFDNIISIIRSRDISVSVIIQSISQLKSKYNEYMSSTIINNCDHILYLAGHDPDTANFIANHMDRTAHTVLKLAREQAVLITEGEDARIITKLKPYAAELRKGAKAEVSPSEKGA